MEVGQIFWYVLYIQNAGIIHFAIYNKLKYMTETIQFIHHTDVQMFTAAENNLNKYKENRKKTSKLQ